MSRTQGTPGTQGTQGPTPDGGTGQSPRSPKFNRPHDESREGRPPQRGEPARDPLAAVQVETPPRPRDGQRSAEGQGDRDGRGDHGGQDGHGGHGDDEQVIPKDLPKVSRKALVIIAVVVLVLLVGLFFLGWLPNHRRQAARKQAAEQRGQEQTAVTVIHPHRTPADIQLMLPGDARPNQETALYPRANGYLSAQYVDVGDRVNAGDLLADISTPDIDAEYRSAVAARELAKANVTRARQTLDLARDTLQRYQGLVTTGGVTKQQLQEKQTDLNNAESGLAAANANVEAADANIKRLEVLRGFEEIHAPFPGVINARNYDLGALLAPNGPTAGRELLRIAQTDLLRVFVNVPQEYVTSIKLGQKAYFTVRNYAGKWFEGTVARTTGSIDPASRTLTYEVDVPNPEQKLWAYMYGQVKFPILQGEPPLLISSSSFIFNEHGTQVAIVQDGKIHFQNIVVGRDLGAEAEVEQGLNGGEVIVSNPGDKLAEGESVRVLDPEAEKKPGAKAEGKVEGNGQK